MFAKQIAAPLIAALISLSGFAAQAAVPAAELNGRLAERCATLPATPSLTGLSQADAGRAVADYAVAIDQYQACLHGVVRERRGELSQSEQAVLAARLSKASYALQHLRLDYASSVRGHQVAGSFTQVADSVAGR